MDKQTGQRILIVDDDPKLRRTLADILKAQGYIIVEANDGKEGIDMFAKEDLDIVLIDLVLPDMPGMDVLETVKKSRPLVEAIILTGNATLDSAIEATNKGAFSYLQKPYEVDQLLLHIRRAIERKQAEEQIIRHNIELERLNAELKTLYEKSRTASLHDPLTGLANRRYLDIELTKSFEAAKRYNDLLSAIMLDIDHFKEFNDTHGHIAGDRLLEKIAGILNESVRAPDHVFRYGGEEFLIMLHGSDLKGTCNLAERLRKAVESETETTVSLGIACFDKTMEKGEELVMKADSALYRAKQNGRNRTETADGSFKNMCASPGESSEGARVLVVDDDRGMVRTLSDILRGNGYDPVEAYSGEMAVERATADAPGCVLMDVRMEGMDGVEALKLINSRSPEIPVLLMSAHANEELMKEAKQNGAYTVLSKPVDIKMLLSSLDFLRKRKTSQ